VWEAANFAAVHILNNLIVIVDNNQFQAYDKTIEVAPQSLEGKWKAFGWNVIKADGHNFSSLHEKIGEALHSSKPTAIIAHTIKGKGLKNLENKLESHYIPPSGNEFGE
jgi:transketolase